jgi:mRNA interferase RelE/StbE
MAEYRVVLTPAAQRQFVKLSHQAREMIAAALLALARNPRPPGCVKLADAEDLWHIRVRQYRVIYQILDDQLIVVVVKIGDRKDAYR